MGTVALFKDKSERLTALSRLVTLPESIMFFNNRGVAQPG